MLTSAGIRYLKETHGIHLNGLENMIAPNTRSHSLRLLVSCIHTLHQKQLKLIGAKATRFQKPGSLLHLGHAAFGERVTACDAWQHDPNLWGSRR